MRITGVFKSVKSYLRDFVKEFKFIAEDMLIIKSRTFDIETSLVKSLDSIGNVLINNIATDNKINSIAHDASNNHKNMLARVEQLDTKINNLVEMLSRPKVNEEAEALRRELSSRTQFYESLLNKLIDARLSQSVQPIVVNNDKEDSHHSPAMMEYLKRKNGSGGFASIDAKAK